VRANEVCEDMNPLHFRRRQRHVEGDCAFAILRADNLANDLDRAYGEADLLPLAGQAFPA
jgi:hypothetical protein